MISRFLNWLFPGAFLVFAVWYISRDPQQYEQLMALPTATAAVLLGLSILVLATLGQQLRVLTSVYGVHLHAIEAFYLATSNTFLNYFPAKAGLVARGVYLKAMHGLPVSDYIAVSAVGQLLSVLISGAIGSAVGLALAVSSGNRLLLLVAGLMFLAILIVSSMMLTSAFLTRIKSSHWLTNFISRVARGITVWKQNSRAVLRCLLYSSLGFFVFSVRLWAAFAAAGTALSATDVIFLQACVGVGFAFSIVPGNLGLREGVLTSTAVLLGADPSKALTAALLDRIASMLIVVLLGSWAIQRLAGSTMNFKNRAD